MIHLHIRRNRAARLEDRGNCSSVTSRGRENLPAPHWLRRRPHGYAEVIPASRGGWDLNRRCRCHSSQHSPGEPAPSAGLYKQINIFGQPNGIRADVFPGESIALPAPIGHSWRQVEGEDGEG